MDSEAIILRLKEVLAHYSLTSSTFADSINVQRSSISHLMSGRNKPSLDFVLKIISKYPEVDLYWLLNGEGEFPKNKKEETPTPISQDLFSVPKQETEQKIEKEEKNIRPSVFPENSTNDTLPEKKSNTRFSESTKKLIKVILLYDDGSFDAYDS